MIETIFERNQEEERLRSALLEKEILLRELYHRTKNNMQVISAMLDLQAGRIADREARTILMETQNKIYAMSLVHQMLYRSQNLSSIDLKDYINDLVDLLMRSYQVDNERVAIQLQTQSIPVQIDTAIPCGLVLTELISNCFKHAFPDEKHGEIKICLTRSQKGKVTLEVCDNGVGVPSGFDFRQQGSLGLQTVFALVENQLDGEVVFRRRQGVDCRICFYDSNQFERNR